MNSSITSWSRAEKIAAACLLLLVLVSYGVRHQLIVENSPYPRHVDEETFLLNSLEMVKQGSARPKTLNWPSLPLYFAAAAHATGYAWERGAGRIDDRSEIRPRAFPFYANANLVLPARFTFAFLSILVMAAIGVIAWRLSGSSAALILAPAILALDSLFLRHSWSYLNVDIIGSFFIVTAIAYLVWIADERESLLHKAVLPGVFCGLAAASKYTNAALVLPFLISIAYSDPRRWLTRGGLLFAVMAISFVISMPYAVLEPERLLEWIGKQREIYASGWPGHTVDPGFPHLARQLGFLMSEYGVVAFAIGFGGLIHTLVRGGRRGVEVVAYPIVFTLYFCSQRVDLVRNLLAVHVLFAGFISLGIVALSRMIAARAGIPGWSEAHVRTIATLLLVLAILSGAPWGRVEAAYRVPRDSRHLALEWIREIVPPGSRIVHARELRFDARSLRDDYVIQSRYLARSQGYGARLLAPDRDATRTDVEAGAYFLVPEYGWRPAWPERAETAEAVNRLFGGGEILATFGHNEIPVLGFETVPEGDPRFTIRQGMIVAEEK